MNIIQNLVLKLIFFYVLVWNSSNGMHEAICWGSTGFHCRYAYLNQIKGLSWAYIVLKCMYFFNKNISSIMNLPGRNGWKSVRMTDRFFSFLFKKLLVLLQIRHFRGISKKWLMQCWNGGWFKYSEHTIKMQDWFFWHDDKLMISFPEMLIISLCHTKITVRSSHV